MPFSFSKQALSRFSMRFHLSFLVGAFFLTALAACGVFGGSFPEPDPLWKATVAFGPRDANGCLTTDDGIPDCASSTEKASGYLSKFLPATPEQLVGELQKTGFNCESRKTMWACAYSRSQPPVACAASIRASVAASFPSNISVVNKMHVEAITAPDPEHIDNRGCMGL